MRFELPVRPRAFHHFEKRIAAEVREQLSRALHIRFAAMRVQEVAQSLYIHPFMLSRWRKQSREGLIMTKGVEVDKTVAVELKALRRMKKDYERLKLEHDILKKAITFTSTRKETSSPLSKRTRRSSP